MFSSKSNDLYEPTDPTLTIFASCATGFIPNLFVQTCRAALEKNLHLTWQNVDGDLVNASHVRRQSFIPVLSKLKVWYQ